MEERVQQIADELGVSAEAYIKSLRSLGELDGLD
jgi:hypothetical protein